MIDKLDRCPCCASKDRAIRHSKPTLTSHKSIPCDDSWHEQPASGASESNQPKETK